MHLFSLSTHGSSSSYFLVVMPFCFLSAAITFVSTVLLQLIEIMANQVSKKISQQQVQVIQYWGNLMSAFTIHSKSK